VAGAHLLVLQGDGLVYFGYTGRICSELRCTVCVAGLV
jgi:hypothetical protein